MKQIFNDGVMEVTEYPEGWVFLRWIDNEKGFLQKRLVKDLVYIEKYILDNHLKGWFTSSELDHRDFQMILHRVGGKVMAKDPSYVYFHKWISKPEDLHNVRKRSSSTNITSISRA